MIEEPKRKVGRPPKYNDALGERICELRAKGLSQREICEEEGMPIPRILRQWLKDNEKLKPKYDEATRTMAENWAEEIITIADDGTNDYMTRQNANGEDYKAVNAEHIQRSRLRVDSRKWVVSKLLPKVYGDKVDVTHSGKVRVVVGGNSDE